MKPVRHPPPGHFDDFPATGQSPARGPDDAARSRGLLMLLLAGAFPDGRAESVLLAEIASVGGDTAGWRQHVAYLEAKGLIRIEAVGVGPEYRRVTLRTFYLTAAGLDLTDGRSGPDVGIYIPQE